MNKTTGFIALITVVIFIVLVSLVSIILAMTSLHLSVGSEANSTKSALDQGISSCLDKVLLQLAFDDTDTSTGSITITMPTNQILTCHVISVVASGVNWNITVDATLSGQNTYARRLVGVSQENLAVVSTQELAN